MRQNTVKANQRPKTRRTVERQAAALAALAQQLGPYPRLTPAAQAAGVHRATVYRWVEHDTAFRAALDGIRAVLLDRWKARYAEEAAQSAAERERRLDRSRPIWRQCAAYARQRKALYARVRARLRSQGYRV